ncbi:transposase [Nitrincola schmidtii]
MHFHCLIPSGVITPSQTWKSRHKRYLLSVRHSLNDLED